MAEDQILLPTTEEKNLKSFPVEITPVIPSSTTVQIENPKPVSHSPSIPLSTPSDSTPPLSVENSDNPKNERFSPLLPETLKEQSKDDIPVPEEKSKSPSTEKASSISPESAMGCKENFDQSTGTPIYSVVAPMEPQERDTIENILAIAAEGIIGKENSTMPESQGEETQSLVGEEAMESSSHVSLDPAPSPHFDAEPLEVVAPVMRSSDEEDQDDVALSVFIAVRRPVATPETPPKRPTRRLQKKEAFESALKKSKRINRKKKKRLVKNGEVDCDKNIPVVEVDEEAKEEPSSLIRKSQKKKHSSESTSKEAVGTPSEKPVKDNGNLKEVMVEEL
ncbi:PREDICTED: uncharacterized protein LOC109221422 [Nicotiana attenuata]|uniref:uncharacterized protein LOC109221422 n=1 Tax=Nicotiana attenuata TaxID=49451 RepID=UPI00090523BD|nr:PREDICTED: uncharacterized protein LOC109221422 [Nicotiana attenuata]